MSHAPHDKIPSLPREELIAHLLRNSMRGCFHCRVALCVVSENWGEVTPYQLAEGCFAFVGDLIAAAPAEHRDEFSDNIETLWASREWVGTT